MSGWWLPFSTFSEICVCFCLDLVGDIQWRQKETLKSLGTGRIGNGKDWEWEGLGMGKHGSI